MERREGQLKNRASRIRGKPSQHRTLASVLQEAAAPDGHGNFRILQEKPGFAKLNRLIDAYEVCLKLVPAISVQSFYGLGLAKEFPETDVKIRESISRASMGHWLLFLREACGCLKQKAHHVISAELLEPDLRYP